MVDEEELELQVIDKTAERPSEPEPKKEEPKKEPKEETKEVVEEESAHIPPRRFLDFCSKISHDQLADEVVALFGKRTPTKAQAKAGVTHGIYTAIEWNKGYESLAHKSGIHIRHEKKEAEAPVGTLQKIELTLE